MRINWNYNKKGKGNDRAFTRFKFKRSQKDRERCPSDDDCKIIDYKNYDTRNYEDEDPQFKNFVFSMNYDNVTYNGCPQVGGTFPNKKDIERDKSKWVRKETRRMKKEKKDKFASYGNFFGRYTKQDSDSESIDEQVMKKSRKTRSVLLDLLNSNGFNISNNSVDDSINNNDTFERRDMMGNAFQSTSNSSTSTTTHESSIIPLTITSSDFRSNDDVRERYNLRSTSRKSRLEKRNAKKEEESNLPVKFSKEDRNRMRKRNAKRRKARKEERRERKKQYREKKEAEERRIQNEGVSRPIEIWDRVNPIIPPYSIKSNKMDLKKNEERESFNVLVNPSASNDVKIKLEY